MSKVIKLLLVFVLFASACQREEKTVEITDEGIHISESWIRPGAKDRNTAVFMTITNNTDLEDTLFSAGSNLAKVVEIHEKNIYMKN